MTADGRNMSLDDEVEHFLAGCKALEGVTATADTAPKFRALQAEEVKLRKRLDETRKAEKEPHLEAGRAVDARYQPKIASISDACRAITGALTKFLQAEDARQRAEAAEMRRKADEERQRAEALAAEAKVEEDPFAAFDKGEEARRVEAEAASLQRQGAAPVKVSIVGEDGGRAAGLKVVGYDVEVTDPAALVAHYAERQELLEAALKIANAEARASKGQAKIPGTTISPIRRAA